MRRSEGGTSHGRIASRGAGSAPAPRPPLLRGPTPRPGSRSSLCHVDRALSDTVCLTRGVGFLTWVARRTSGGAMGSGRRLEAWAAARGVSPGQAAKAIVCWALDVRAWRSGCAGGEGVGSAAPRQVSLGRAKSGRASSGFLSSAPERRGPASSRPALGRGSSASGPAAAPSRAPGFMHGEVFDRPTGSAGSTVPVPPAGVAAPVVDPPPAAGAPDSGFVPVLEAVAAPLRAQGMAGSQAVLVARKAILGGQVVVDGEVCRDPDDVG
jgi:hypothetical protein